MPLRARRVAVQEYGAPNPELLQALEERGALLTRVPIYQWALPEDLEPLRQACRALAEGQVDVVLLTTATQVHPSAAGGRPARAGRRRARAASPGRWWPRSVRPPPRRSAQRRASPSTWKPSHPEDGLPGARSRRAGAHAPRRRTRRVSIRPMPTSQELLDLAERCAAKLDIDGRQRSHPLVLRRGGAVRGRVRGAAPGDPRGRAVRARRSAAAGAAGGADRGGAARARRACSSWSSPTITPATSGCSRKAPTTSASPSAGA